MKILIIMFLLICSLSGYTKKERLYLEKYKTEGRAAKKELKVIEEKIEKIKLYMSISVPKMRDRIKGMDNTNKRREKAKLERAVKETRAKLTILIAGKAKQEKIYKEALEKYKRIIERNRIRKE